MNIFKTILITSILVGVYTTSILASASKKVDEFSKTITYQANLHHGSTYVNSWITVLPAGDVSCAADIVFNQDSWSILDVRKGDDIKFIVNGNSDNVLTLPVVSVGNDIGNGYVLEQRIFEMSKDLFERFASATSIKCKVGTRIYEFTTQDIQDFKDVLDLYYQDYGYPASTIPKQNNAPKVIPTITTPDLTGVDSIYYNDGLRQVYTKDSNVVVHGGLGTYTITSRMRDTVISQGLPVDRITLLGYNEDTTRILTCSYADCKGSTIGSILVTATTILPVGDGSNTIVFKNQDVRGSSTYSMVVAVRKAYKDVHPNLTKWY